MWVRINLDLTSIFLALAIGAGAAVYALIALGGLLAAGWVRHPRRALRIAAWSGGLAASSVVLGALLGLVEPRWLDASTVPVLLWMWLALFLSGLALIVWQAATE